MGNWDEFQKGIASMGRGMEVLGLTGVAGSWVDENLEEIKEQAVRWEMSADDFLLLAMWRGLTDLKETSAETVAFVRKAAEATGTPAQGDEPPVRTSWCEEHNNYKTICKHKHERSRSVGPDWVRDDDDAEDGCPNKQRCRHPDRVHNVEGKCQICDCNSRSETPAPPKTQGGLYGNL